MTIAERLRAFMLKYELSREQMAAALRTPSTTFDDWINQSKPRIPPACMQLMMDILEQSTQARRIAGIHTGASATPRGKPFKRGNPYRFKPKAKPGA